LDRETDNPAISPSPLVEQRNRCQRHALNRQTPCRGGVPPLARDEALRFQSQASEWVLRDDARRIERTFRFRNFREALAFVQQVGELAKTEGHHRHQFRLGLRDRLVEHQKDQGTARDRARVSTA